MAKPKRVLWLVAEVTPEYRAKQQLLEKHNHHVTWVHTLSDLAKEVTLQRAHAVVISEEGPPAMVCDHILGLSSLTEAKGSRWILTLKDYNPKVIKFATGSNFRDLIPLAMPANQWIFRFLFASASRAVNYPLPAGQITLGHRTDVKLPFRLIWLSERTLRMETHIIPSLGARLMFTSSYLTELGATAGQLLVEKVEHSQLSYRFSTAIEGSWSMVGGPPPERVAQLIRQLQAYSPKPRYRIFIAVKNSEVRKKLLRNLRPDQFEVNSALQVRSLTQEPLFFSPDLVIVDSIFCQLPYREHFQKMLANLSVSVPIMLIVGASNQPYPGTGLFGDRKVHYVRDADGEFLHLLHTHLPEESVLTTRQQKGAAYFDHDDRLAFGEITMTGKINKLHPIVTELALPYAIKDFALCQLHSPLLAKWLNKNPWVKLTQLHAYSSPDEGLFRFTAPAFFVDVSEEEKRSLTAHLGRFIAKVLGFTSGLLNEPSKPPAATSAPVSPVLTTSLAATPVVQALVPQISPESARDTASSESTDDRKLAAVKAGFTPTPSLRSSSLGRTISAALTSQSLRYFLAFVIVTSALLAFFIEVVPRLVPYYKRSGSTYVNQLHRFSNKGSADSEGGSSGSSDSSSDE